MTETKNAVNNANITEIVNRFARVCRLRSIGVFSDDSTHRQSSENESSEGTTERSYEDNEHDPQKIYPWDPKNPKPFNVDALETLVSKLFANVSALKAAYVQLQAAHTPYDPEKIQSADRAVIEELKNLSELKHLYREKERDTSSVGSPAESKLLAEIQEQQSMLKTYEVMVKKFQAQIQTRDSELDKLKNELKEAHEKRETLEKRLRQKYFGEPENPNPNPSSESPNDLTLKIFVSAVHASSKSAHEFTKLIISMMKTAEWDLDAAANSIEPDIKYAKRAHKKYAFESYVCQKIFSGFQNESFCVSDSVPMINDFEKQKKEFSAQFQYLQSREAFDVLTSDPESPFAKFCHEKYLSIVHPKMEESFFGNLDQRNHISNGGHPRTSFYRAFLKVAKQIWLLHRLAYCFDPKVNIFQVRRGTDFSEIYMESIVKNVELADDTTFLRPKVGFTVMPGFRVGKSIIQCQVYLTVINLESSIPSLVCSGMNCKIVSV